MYKCNLREKTLCNGHLLPAPTGVLLLQNRGHLNKGHFSMLQRGVPYSEVSLYILLIAVLYMYVCWAAT